MIFEKVIDLLDEKPIVTGSIIAGVFLAVTLPLAVNAENGDVSKGHSRNSVTAVEFPQPPQ